MVVVVVVVFEQQPALHQKQMILYISSSCHHAVQVTRFIEITHVGAMLEFLDLSQDELIKVCMA